MKGPMIAGYHYHMSIDIFGALRKSDKQLDGYLSNEGTSLPGHIVRAELEKHALTGKKCFTGCNNETSEGTCAGHAYETDVQ